MICWSCQADNPAAAKFCFNCGSRLVADPVTEKPCRVCAAPLPLDARFCGNCGTPEPLAPAVASPPPTREADAAALAHEDDAEDEATVLRTQLEEAPMIPAKPGLPSRERSRTEPSKVASSRTLAERLGRGPVDESPGVYSKQGPSLRKAEAQGKSPPPPPPIAASRSRPGEIPPPPPTRKADTARKLPRAGLPSLPSPPGMPSQPGMPGLPGLAARPAAPGEAAPARPVAARAVAPLGGARPGPAGPRPAAGAGPLSTRRAEPASARAPRPSADPPKAPFGSPRPSEAAALLATPAGWPDITDELAEVRFSSLQGFDEDDVVAEVMALRLKYPGHPDVEALAVELGVTGTEPPSDEPVALPAGMPSASGAPRATSTEPELTPVDGPPPLGRYAGTSDELLDVNADEFDDLEPGPDDSMSDLTLVDNMGFGLHASGDYDGPGFEDSDELPLSGNDEPSPASEPDFVDRTMMVRGLQPPAPFGAPTSDRRDDDERSTTLPPGGFVIDQDEPPTLAGMAFDEDEPPTLAGMAFDEDEPSTLSGLDFDGAEPPTLVGLDLDDVDSPPDSHMTAPDRDADSAAASGTFNVADLDLDDMPDLSGPPPELDLDPMDDDEQELELELEPDAVTTQDGTVVARAPVPPAPYGQGDAPLPVMPVRLVMLGPRGEAVAERLIEAGSYLDLGRQPGEPWGEDRRMAPLHARLFPAPGGVVIDDFGLPSGVYTQIFDTIAVEDGDEFKVGQARLALQRTMGPGGSWGQLTLVRHDSPAPETVVLVRDEIILGREEGDVVFPSDTFVSGDHCRFVREGHAVYLEDLGSSNGTYIRVRAGQCVAYGGLLLVGHTQFEVHPG